VIWSKVLTALGVPQLRDRRAPCATLELVRGQL
jgi:hypothetical protein